MSTRLLAPCALAAVATLLVPADAGAIPAFARRYRFSCTTCHAPIPALKPYGAEFAARGFALPPGEEPARAELDLGDELLQLPRDLPVALRFDGYAQLRDETPKLDLQAPWIFKILAGGRIADGVGFYTYFIIEEGDVVGLEDAYVQLSSIFGLPLDVLAGQFQVSDPIAKRELRLERLDYQVLRTRVGESTVDLTYDRGVALAAGLGPVDAILLVTNGTGIEPGAPFDRDSFKNFALHLSGEAGPVRLGVFGLAGKQRGDGGAVNTTLYAGPQAGVSLGDLVDLNAVVLWRRDSNAFFGAGPHGRTLTRGGFAEAVGYPRGRDGRWVLAALFNRVTSDDAEAEAESIAATVTWLYRRNVRLSAEIDRDVEAGTWVGSLGTTLAF